MNDTDNGNRTAWWGTCEDCTANVVIYPHPEREDDLPPMDDWERGGIFSQCYVCDGDIEWGGADPVKAVLR